MDNNNNTETFNEQKDLTFKEATGMMRQFVRERDWVKYHTPRNLVLALTGQVGQIAQLFQWKGEVQNGLKGFSEKEKTNVGEEIADVLSYLIRLADVCEIDIETAFKDKLVKNRKKYPSQQIKANSNLFFEIKDQRRVKREGTGKAQQTKILQQNIKESDSNQKKNE